MLGTSTWEWEYSQTNYDDTSKLEYFILEDITVPKIFLFLLTYQWTKQVFLWIENFTGIRQRIDYQSQKTDIREKNNTYNNNKIILYSGRNSLP